MEKEFPLHDAISDNDMPLVKDLVIKNSNNKAFLNLKSLSGNTPLHTAAAFGNEEAFRLLMKQDLVDPNIQNISGNTVAMTATICHRKNGIFDLICKHPDRFDFSIANNNRTVPLLYLRNLKDEDAMDQLMGTRKDLGENQIMIRFSTSHAMIPLNKKIYEYRRDRPILNAAEIFAQIYLIEQKIHTLELEPANEPSKRFFAMTSKLPTELQMLIANKSQGSPKQFVSNSNFQRFLVSNLR